MPASKAVRLFLRKYCHNTFKPLGIENVRIWGYLITFYAHTVYFWPPFYVFPHNKSVVQFLFWAGWISFLTCSVIISLTKQSYQRKSMFIKYSFKIFIDNALKNIRKSMKSCRNLFLLKIKLATSDHLLKPFST